MQYTTIPGTDMQASRICLGTMTFGSPVAGPDAVRLVRYALEEHGVNFIDTANMYEGYNRYVGSAGGVAEEIVGEAVAHRRGDYILATKVGMKVGEAPEDENTSPEAIRIQLRRSLVRMRTDYVDVYYLHRYDPDTEPHAVARAMGEELRAGTIRAWGVSNYTAAQLAALLAEKPEWMKPFTNETYDVIERCAAEAAAEGVTMTQHALRWALAQPGVVSALVGVKREEQIDEAAGAVR